MERSSSLQPLIPEAGYWLNKRPPKTMLGKCRRDIMRIEEIREKVGACPVKSKTEKTQVRWLGLLKRMDDRSVGKRCEWRPGAGRLRGRLKRR